MPPPRYNLSFSYILHYRKERYSLYIEPRDQQKRQSLLKTTYTYKSIYEEGLTPPPRYILSFSHILFPSPYKQFPKYKVGLQSIPFLHRHITPMNLAFPSICQNSVIQMTSGSTSIVHDQWIQPTLYLRYKPLSSNR